MNSHKRWLRQLREAQDGQPTEYQAARTIALSAAFCAAMVGLLANTLLIGVADPMGLLPWVFIATAIVSGFGAAYLVLGVYYKFGFRPVVVLADALVSTVHGMYFGFGLFLVSMFLMPLGVPLIYMLCPLPLIPIAAFTISLFRAWSRQASDRKAEVQAVELQTGERMES